MMTRVVQNIKTEQVLVFCKGADSSIIPRCTTNNEDIQLSVDKFANQGYRTLTFAFKQLKNDQIDIYTQEDIESGLTLIAATGVEDLLQDDVATCLNQFKQAGIKTWMLTGDKGETARSIGISCGLLS